MDDWTTELKVTCPSTPLQIEGQIEGTFVYYRERHGAWTVGFGDTADDALFDVRGHGTVMDGTFIVSDAFARIFRVYRAWKG